MASASSLLKAVGKRSLLCFFVMWSLRPSGASYFFLHFGQVHPREMVPGMIKHAVHILRLFVTDGTAIICFSHHFTTGLALLLCIAYDGVEFFLHAKISRDGERHGIQDCFLAGVQQTLSLQHLLLKLICLSVGFLGGRRPSSVGSSISANTNNSENMSSRIPQLMPATAN